MARAKKTETKDWYVRFHWSDDYLVMKTHSYTCADDSGFVTSFKPAPFSATLHVDPDDDAMMDDRTNKRWYVMRPKFFRQMARQGVINRDGSVTGLWGWTRQGTNASITFLGEE